jgi:mRNA-degrading endonuclease RelE of RelBE toxin-antitoxin system
VTSFGTLSCSRTPRGLTRPECGATAVKTHSSPYEWDWELTDTARRDFDGLDEYARDRIASKLDEIVTDEWRNPRDHLEPLHGAPHQKLRIGPFRLGCRTDRTDNTLYILRIRKRGGDAYRSDDD